jgi:hypothetical protein
MKAIAWLIAFSLAVLPVFGQTEDGSQWKAPSSISIEHDQKIYQISDKETCVLEMPIIKDKCVYEWSGFESKSSIETDGLQLELSAPKIPTKRNYIYNFAGHLSVSMAPKLSEMSLSKFRIEFEKDLKSEHFTTGALLSMYTLEYYYKGYRLEGFSRFYFVPNSSGEGGFIQARAGYSKFWGGPGPSFGGIGFGADVGNKFIVIGNNRDYSNSFTITPMGGIQAYPGPDGTIPVSWVWQLRFGYQFGGGYR